ncbi:MAG: glycosyltransferase family 4 protein [Phycisphaerales bacterium]|nr:MAG: glycosyltransferase family 4 protein [Phycisphaerales bacterium]
MKVFMLGWEFPPFISGGLGTACYGLTKAMDRLGIEITFVLPKMIESEHATHVQLLSPTSPRSKAPAEFGAFQHLAFRHIPSVLRPYAPVESEPQEPTEQPTAQEQRVAEDREGSTKPSEDGMDYSGDMSVEIHRYAEAAAKLAQGQPFDLIHAHDWMTYPAGMLVQQRSGKPLVAHVHSTEFDRSGEHVHQMIYEVERAGMHAADRIIAVSCLTRNIITARYGVAGEKVDVVYNGVEPQDEAIVASCHPRIDQEDKIVLFLGRITMQKGPEYFLQAARKVLACVENVKFVMAGSGDMMHRVIEMAAEMGIGSKVLFTGFLRGDDVKKAYQMADLYVMPSVSEPFGIVALEALAHGVPVLMSKQSGASEVLRHVLKVDFWDTDQMANKIVTVLRNPPLRSTLREHGNMEVRRLGWDGAAERCVKIYAEMVVGI